MAELAVAGRKGYGLEMSLNKKQDEQRAGEGDEAQQAFSAVTTATPSPTVTTSLSVTGSVFEPTQSLSKFTWGPHSLPHSPPVSSA